MRPISLPTHSCLLWPPQERAPRYVAAARGSCVCVKDYAHAEGLLTAMSSAEDAHAESAAQENLWGLMIRVAYSHAVVFILIMSWRGRTGGSGHSGGGRPVGESY